MTRRCTGTTLIAVSAFLYATHFITAAIFGSGLSSWSTELFRNMLYNTDQGLSTASLVSLIAGVLYLVGAEIGSLLTKDTPD